MIKYIIISLLLFCTLHATDYKAKQVTKKNLEALQNIDKELYKLATQEESYSFANVSNFIYKNLAYKLDYSLLKIDATGGLRFIKNVENSSVYTQEGSRAQAEVMLTYPLWDEKEKNERQKKVLDTKQKIISQVKKYFQLKAEYKDLKIQKLILLQLEIRTKARKLTAVGSFDDWLKVLQDLRKVNADTSKTEIELSEAKQLLLSFVRKPAKKQLEEML